MELDRYRGAYLLIVIGLTLGSAGCTPVPQAPVTSSAPGSGAAATGGASAVDPMITGTALPAGYHIDTGRSLILGGGDNWTGRLSYTASGTADDVFDFLRREMPNFGWVELNAVRSETNLLTFASEATSRIATIQVDRGTVLGGTRVDMVVSPAKIPEAPRAVPPPRPRPRPPAPPLKQPAS